MSRVNKFFRAWYQPNVTMRTEDWLYIAYLLLASMCAFGVGLLLGLLWSLAI
jgi:hypothetical protein